MGEQMFDTIAQVAQTAVGLCFGYAALAKLVSFRRFEEGLASFEIVDPALERPVGIAVVVLESTVAFAFLTGLAVHCGVAASTLLLAIFAAATVSLKLRRVSAVCMCFGGVGEQFNAAKVLVRLMLIGVGVGIVWVDVLYSAAPDSRPWWATTIAAVCTMAACAVAEDMPAMWGVASGRLDRSRATHGGGGER